MEKRSLKWIHGGDGGGGWGWGERHTFRGISELLLSLTNHILVLSYCWFDELKSYKMFYEHKCTVNSSQDKTYKLVESMSSLCICKHICNTWTTSLFRQKQKKNPHDIYCTWHKEKTMCSGKDFISLTHALAILDLKRKYRFPISSLTHFIYVQY